MKAGKSSMLPTSGGVTSKERRVQRRARSEVRITTKDELVKRMDNSAVENVNYS